MYNLNWSRSDLTRQKLGTFCEYYAKMSLASYGVSIYTSEVDDHGIDFIAESKRGFLKFQVKAIRKGTGYVFMREEYFDISDQSLYLFLLLLNDGEHPIEYLIPATTWDNDSSNTFDNEAVLWEMRLLYGGRKRHKPYNESTPLLSLCKYQEKEALRQESGQERLD